MKQKLIYAPIDNKNLLEDAFEDDVFGGFYAAPDHRKHNIRHLVGHVRTADPTRRKYLLTY